MSGRNKCKKIRII